MSKNGIKVAGKALELTITCEELQYLCQVDRIHLAEVSCEGLQLVKLGIRGELRQIQAHCRIGCLLLLLTTCLSSVC